MLCRFCSCLTDNYKAPPDAPNWPRWRCKECSSIGYRSIPKESELSEIYQKAWNDSKTSRKGNFASGSTDDKISDSLIKLALKYAIEKSNFLDYGAGKGNLTKRFIHNGIKNVSAVEPFGPNPNLQNINWYKSIDLVPDEQNFNLIFMIEVIEHLTDPVEQLKKILNKLNHDGWLFITTPNTRGINAILNGEKWKESNNPTHINLFSYSGLSALLRKSGFKEIIRVRGTVNYKNSFLSSKFLSLTQLLQIDGGLRVLAR